jgi:hypothetical protein
MISHSRLAVRRNRPLAAYIALLSACAAGVTILADVASAGPCTGDILTLQILMEQRTTTPAAAAETAKQTTRAQERTSGKPTAPAKEPAPAQQATSVKPTTPAQQATSAKQTTAAQLHRQPTPASIAQALSKKAAEAKAAEAKAAEAKAAEAKAAEAKAAEAKAAEAKAAEAKAAEAKGPDKAQAALDAARKADEAKDWQGCAEAIAKVKEALGQ